MFSVHVHHFHEFHSSFLSLLSDYKAERNALARFAYPELQQYCIQLGLDFQVVDLRWGVTDEVINDHQVSELCLREIATCQQVSLGPHFVVCLSCLFIFLIIIIFLNVFFFNARVRCLPHIKSLHISLNAANSGCNPSHFMSSFTHSPQVFLQLSIHENLV